MKRHFFYSVITGLLFIGCGAHTFRMQGNEIILILRRPQANRVMLACSLDGYSLRPSKNVSGRWEVSLPADKAFRYFYRVDGQLFVPDCPMKEHDDFGSENCLFDPEM